MHVSSASGLLRKDSLPHTLFSLQQIDVDEDDDDESVLEPEVETA